MLSMTWMKRTWPALALLGALAAPAAGQGWVEPGVNRGGFAVDKTRSDVRLRVEGRVAHIEVSEWFINRGRRLAEGDYLYPLPGEAVFQGFSLFQGDAELRGEIMSAERAREIYEEIVRRRADPALIEMAGQGLLRARVFPIQPGEERRVTLRYTQVLERAGNALQLLYAGGVRGGANAAGVGPAGERPQTRPVAEEVESSFEVRIEDGGRFLDPFSPTHGLSVERDSGELSIGVDEAIVGRLSLFLPLRGDAVGMSVATHRPAGEDGYFMLMLSPDRDTEAVEPRDMTVVLDVSGSMSGEKIEQARQALHQLLGTLSRQDRFRLIAFSNAVHRQSGDWSPASGRALDRAREWVDDLVADGGTNIEAALNEAFRLESPEERLPVVIFLTDGLPSVGEQSPERLADRAEARAGRARVFAFGVGHDVNTHLLDRLGQAGRGATDYVQPGENVERVMSLLATKIRHPVLTDLELSGGPMGVDEVYPVRIPDLFAGEELVLFGRFEGEGQGQMTVSGRRRGDGVEFSTELVFPESSESNAYIPRLWAARKLGHLERQLWTEGETASLAEEIRTLALRYGLPSRYTSYLVEEPTLVAGGAVPPGGTRPLLDRLMPGRGGSAQMAPAAAASGAEAVQAAREARDRRETTSTADIRRDEDRLESELQATERWAGPMKSLGGRLFAQRDGVWTDVAHREGRRVVDVEAFSSAYFALLNAIPELRPVLRELGAVVVAGAEVSLRIGDEGLGDMSTSELRELVEDFRGVDGAR